MTELSSSNSEQTNKTILTEEFKKKVHAVLGGFSDETEVVDFWVRSEKIIPNSTMRRRAVHHNMLVNTPPEWKNFIDSIGPSQKAVVISTFSQLVKAGYQNFGEIRRSTVDEIASKAADHRIIGTKRAGFIKEVFPKLAS